MSNQPSPYLKTLMLKVEPWIQLARLHDPAGPLMLSWPVLLSLAMAARTRHLDVTTFAIGTFSSFIRTSFLHSAGCIWNDIVDRDIDRQVERTKHRPVADKRISVPGALIFLFMHLILLVRVIWNSSSSAFRLGMVYFIILPGIYPFTKRVTYWAQAWLGVTACMGIPMAWLVLKEDFPMTMMTFSLGICSWIIWCDTIYACQDMRDDAKAGVYSAALLFGSHVKPIVGLFGGVTIICFAVSGVENNMGASYFLIGVCGTALHLAKQLHGFDPHSTSSCAKLFHANSYGFGTILWLGIVIDYIVSL